MSEHTDAGARQPGAGPRLQARPKPLQARRRRWLASLALTLAAHGGWAQAQLPLQAQPPQLLPAQPTPAVTQMGTQVTATPSTQPGAGATDPARPGSAGPNANPNSSTSPDAQRGRRPLPPRGAGADLLPEPSEFERLVTEANAGRPVWRLGARTQRVEGGLQDLEAPARVPPGYVVQVGDEISVTVWGSLDTQVLLRVDRAGRVTLPRVGPVPVAGARAGDLERLLRARLAQVFKSFELSAAVTDVSPLRVHITGFVERPGDFIVPGLTTISGAVALAQGPSAGGSYRRIRLLRDDATVAVFDLYSLLREGSRRDDRVLQPGDVLVVEPVGPQVAALGSVNRPAVFEFLPGESVADLLRLAGGFSSVAERDVVVIERLRDRKSLGAVELTLPRDNATPLADGDILRVRSQVVAGLPSQLRNKRVLVEGEVRSPGEYLLPASATLADAVDAAGGPTPTAFLYGTTLRRESVRITQEANYERALREIETDLARSATNRSTRDDSVADAENSARQLVARLRNRRPEGRVVLDVTPESTRLPALELEDGDRVQLPPGNQSIGVFGSVYNAGSFVHDAARQLGQYIQRAGGPTEGADYSAVFVVRANGSVLSARQGSRWGRMQQFESQAALPGDTVFVPEELFRGSFVQGAKDWTQILYQLGVGLAALRTVR